MILWLFGLSAAYAIALNGTMVMPLIVLSMGRLAGYDEGLATLVASAELAGIAVWGLLLAAPVNRRGLSVTWPAVVAVLVGEIASALLSDPGSLAAARFLAGLGEGALFSMVTMRIASVPDAERIWGALNLIGGVAMGILLFVASALSNEGASWPIYACVAVFCILMLPLFPFIARKTPGHIQPHEATPMPRRRLMVTLGMVALIYAVQAGQWAICGYVGEHARLPAAQVGLFLAISSVVGFAGAAVPMLVHAKSLRLPAIILGLVLMGGSLYAFFNIMGAAVFVGAQSVLNIGFYAVTPFLTGLLTEHDRDGSLMARALVIALVGAALGTAIAGPILGAAGTAGFGWAFLALLAVATVLGIAIFGPLHPRSGKPAAAE